MKYIVLDSLGNYMRSFKTYQAASTYKGFIIFVVWVARDGITGFIFYNDRLVSCIHYLYKEPEKIIKQSKKYIDYIKPLLSSCE